MLKAISIVGVAVAVGLTLSAPAHADTITYSNRLIFEAALGTSVTDNYSAPGYEHGDVSDTAGTDIFTNRQ